MAADRQLPSPSLAQALAGAQARGLARLDAQLLLLHALGQPAHARAWLLAHDGDLLDDAAAARFQALSRRRAAGEPLAYLVGRKEFFGLELQVDARVLVPRPDTETLVQWALDLLPPRTAPAPAPRILDLGTGSGAIALALAHQFRQDGRSAHIVAVDASTDALAVAAGNAQRLGLELDCLQSHWLDRVEGRFELIVSNPPYVASADPHLAALVYEPREALVAGADGLADLRQIIAQAPQHLLPGGWLLLEHGHDQAAAVRALLDPQGFERIESRLDLAGIARCTGGQWPG